MAVAEGYPLPRALAGLKVTFGTIDAPMLAIARLAGGASAHFAASPSDPWPVFFTDSSGYAIAQHAAGFRPVTPSDPAKPDEWITVYATNLGFAENQPASGNPAAATLLAPIVADTSPLGFSTTA